MKRKLLLLAALILVLFVSVGYGDQSAKICDECGSTQNVKTYWIKSPYGEILFKNLCPNCVEVYRISVSMMNGTMGEASESDVALWESVTGGTQQSAPTRTPIPDTYTLAPGTTPSPELAKENPALYLRLLDQLKKESQPAEIIWPSHKSEGWDLIDLTGIPLENQTAEERTREELAGPYFGEGDTAVMQYLDLSTEEYLEYIQAHPHIALFKDDMLQYEIFRQEVGTADPIDVVLTRNAVRHYSSLDNAGGVITVFMYSVQ